MLTAALTLCAGILAFIFYEIKRSDAKSADPLQQNRERYQQIDEDIVKAINGNSQPANVHSDNDLDELERLERVQDGGSNPG